MTVFVKISAAAMLCLTAGMTALHTSAATAPGSRSESYTEIEAGYARESLTNNLADWHNLYLELHHRIKKRHAASLGFRETRRFGLSDTEIYGSYYYPPSENWNLVLEANGSPTHRVLAQYSLGGQLQRVLPGGWLVGAGLRHNTYTQSESRVITLGVERYWGDFRAAYTLFSGRPEGGASAAAHRFQFNYYYSDRDSTGLSFTTGREVENIGLGALRTTEVRNWTLSGRHWFTRNWALSYDLSTHRQGNLYRREGLRLGLRYRF